MAIDESEKRYATPQELAEINESWKKALEASVMTFRTGDEDMASAARRIVIDRIHKLAAEHGCPENGNPWGMRLDTGEFTQEDT